jgi:ribose 5-phosphate isomerase
MSSIENFPRVDLAKLEVTGALPIEWAPVTAEAVKREYESAAKEFEAMGAELISAAKKCQALTSDVQNMIRDTAEAYRQEGKKIFERVEECAFFTEDIRKTCEDVRRRITDGNSGVHQ